MKEKQKFEPTRKQKALKRSVICLLTILAAVYICHYGFFPSSAIRQIEEDMGTGRTRVLTWMRDLPGRGKGALYALSVNENALLLSRVSYLFPFGWWGNCYCVVDCSKEAPAHIGYTAWSSEETGEDGLYTEYMLFYGRVDDPAVVRTEIVLDYYEEDDPDLVLPVDSYMDKRNGTYFVQSTDSPVQHPWLIHANCYDAEGALVYTTELKYW